ncbi:MAG: glycosyltransferase family 2 protein [Candidatus Omnitrophota bacterium]
MKATIAIPTKNRTKFLGEALDGAVGQDFEDYEILIGDSSDREGVMKKVEPYLTQGKVRYLRLPPETPLIEKFNTLLNAAQGEWMVYLCDDDILHKEYLPVLLRRAQEHPQATLIRCRFKIIDEAGKLVRMDPDAKEVMRPAEFLGSLFSQERQFFKMSISGILFHRRTLIEEGGISSFPSAWHSDLLAWAKVGSRGLSLYDKRCLACIRTHPGSETSTYSAELGKDIQTNLGVRKVIKDLLKRIEEESTDPKDRAWVERARKKSWNYMQRHLSRIFDHSFLNMLSASKPKLWKDVKSLLETMKRMDVPMFNSARIYAWLGYLPYPVRRPMVDVLKRYKTEKWCH